MPIVDQTAIFQPMLVVVALTFVALLRMAAARAKAIKGGHDPAFYRAHMGAGEPEQAVVAVRHYGNLFELPVLFYAACLTAFVLGAVTGAVLVLAWCYVACRLVQSAVHLTYNNPAHRGGAFVLGAAFVLALWAVLAMTILSRPTPAMETYAMENAAVP